METYQIVLLIIALIFVIYPIGATILEWLFDEYGYYIILILIFGIPIFLFILLIYVDPSTW